MLLLNGIGMASAIQLNLDSEHSFNNATKDISRGIIDYYDGNHYGGTIGVMSPPYYWWESASAFSGLHTYGLMTGDKQYEELLYQSIMAQMGENLDFITQNQSMVEGNDDQGYWAMFSMDLAERDFKNPPEGGTWATLAQNVFDQMVTRWDPICGGGLRWQIFDWNKGFNYKNTVSTGAMFNIAARLGRYTLNQTYIDWAHKIYDWMADTEFIVELSNSSSTFHIYDGAGTESNCQVISKAEWSYNYGAILSGMASLYDVSGNKNLWLKRIEMTWDRASSIFFDSNMAMQEPSCQQHKTCNNDQRSFRASFSRFLGHVAVFLPKYQDSIIEHLRASANLAARSCSGGSDGRTCGQDWSHDGWDGVYGLGEEMAALEVILNAHATKLGKPMQNPGGKGAATHKPQSWSQPSTEPALATHKPYSEISKSQRAVTTSSSTLQILKTQPGPIDIFATTYASSMNAHHETSISSQKLWATIATTTWKKSIMVTSSQSSSPATPPSSPTSSSPGPQGPQETWSKTSQTLSSSFDMPLEVGGADQPPPTMVSFWSNNAVTSRPGWSAVILNFLVYI